ncbi:MAG TPA: hypothetical protein VLE70_04315 [Anaerolineae bacterium]|nr:hypothetical protein [Anaerolineae bacterium]
MERQNKDPSPLMVMVLTADYPDPDSFLRVAPWLRNGGWRHAEYKPWWKAPGESPIGASGWPCIAR